MATKITVEDINKYILKIRVNFENAYSLNTDENLLLISSWLDILQNYPKEVCEVAVNNVLARAKFAPHIGDIVEEIKVLQNIGSKTDEELWAELKSIKYEVFNESVYLSYPQQFDEAYNKISSIYNNLSSELKLFLVNVNALIDFAKIPNEELTYEKNLFFKRMPVLRKHSEDKTAAQNFLQLANQNIKQLKLNSKK